jgi:hypothetical protein
MYSYRKKRHKRWLSLNIQTNNVYYNILVAIPLNPYYAIRDRVMVFF